MMINDQCDRGTASGLTWEKAAVSTWKSTHTSHQEDKSQQITKHIKLKNYTSYKTQQQIAKQINKRESMMTNWKLQQKQKTQQKHQLKVFVLVLKESSRQTQRGKCCF